MNCMQAKFGIALVLLSAVACVTCANAQTSDATLATPQAVSDAAQTVVEIVDRSIFDSSYATQHRVDFAAAAGKTAPFATGSVRISGGNAQVLDSLTSLPASFWFGDQTTSPDFLLANFTVQVTFRHPLRAIGFDVQCFACDSDGQPTPFIAILLGQDGDVIGYQQAYLNTLTGNPPGMPGFLGFDSERPFTSIVLHRDGNWMMANLRYVYGARSAAD
jgi:hypothetical protein